MSDPTKKDAGVGTITLTFHPEQWHLDIKATVGNFDMALAMLDQARRWFETRVRARDSIQLGQELAEQQQHAAILASVRNGHRQ